jgi:hypothetical protein
MSHLNCKVRKLFETIYITDILEKLGVQYIRLLDVNLTPELVKLTAQNSSSA